MDEETLQAIGLTKGEANVYLTLVKVGCTSTGTLITESSVSRSKVYDVLERLKQKGFVCEVTKRNVRHFEATSPSRITQYLEKKKNILEKQISDSESIVENLVKLRSSHLEKQEAKVYTGIEGIQTVFDEIVSELTHKDEYVAFGLGKKELQSKQIQRLIYKFHLSRADKKISSRIIVEKGTGTEMAQFDNLKYYDYRFSTDKFPTNIAIWKDNVLTLVWGEQPMAFLIKSAQVSQKYKTYFAHVWKKSSLQN